MRVRFSKEFEKSIRKLSGKVLESVKEMIQEVKNASDIKEITDCKKLVGYDFAYRIRIGGYRAIFTFHVEVADDVVMFQYFVSRGDAYSKKIEASLRKRDL